MTSPLDILSLPATPSATWTPPKLTQEMLTRYRNRKLIVAHTGRLVDTEHPDYPNSSYAMLLAAKEDGALNKQSLYEHFIKMFWPDVKGGVSALGEGAPIDEDDDDYRDEVAGVAYRSIMAGTACSDEPDKLKLLELIHDTCEGNYINITKFREAVEDLRGTAHHPLTLFDLPVTEHAYRLYHDLFEIKEPIIRKVISQGLVDPFKQIFSLFKSRGDGDQIKNMVGEISLAGSQAIRQYLYDANESSLDEDIYGRLLGSIAMIDDEFPFLVEGDDIPSGFFAQYGDQLWYEVVDALSKSNFTMKNIGSPEKQPSIKALIDTMALLFKQHDFYPAMMARTQGRNLASLPRFRQSEQPDQQGSLSTLITWLSSQSYALYSDGSLVEDGIGVAGKLKPYLVIKAIHQAYPAKAVEQALADDNQRILFYRATGKPLYLRNLRDRSLSDQLIGQDLGL
ncbi:hypothetical protein [Pseudomonas amygdali]|uniref:Uncharacterized protein n=2 Tax=Pseudomonas amygdali pv. lachrymans TaxID=53707 RepID=A0ABR5KRG6_PSEAV|nr:hypothetical protein [Pseudomonas amygdali]KPC17244.1 Uncharacterized protein AC499_0446 [Pseudomonas amygdali pv. lachrymans]KPC18203.1 Uncharacterized protein AC499_1405 [Pseudomonas amygdali pv. lachrymans]